ncbi:MAG: hypothetical protein LBL66_02425, partial [Clostridiales bacterium]|nr:hypothetical protein [Clostridiales bacterium]
MRYFQIDLNLYPALPARQLHTVLANLAVKDREIVKGRGLFPIGDCGRYIGRHFRGLERKARKGGPLDEFEKWLYDNHSVIESAAESVKADNGAFRKLPYAGGVPRAYRFAGRVLKHADGHVTEEWIQNAVEAYQAKESFEYRELVYLPLAFRCAALEFLCA